jgi:hypothetical protein
MYNGGCRSKYKAIKIGMLAAGADLAQHMLIIHETRRTFRGNGAIRIHTA